jgi:hypothetical protein
VRVRLELKVVETSNVAISSGGTMVLGDGITRNIASVDPSERALFRDALIQLNHRYFAGSRNETPPLLAC